LRFEWEMDSLANALNALKVAEEKGSESARIKPASKTIREVLLVLQKHGFVSEFEFVDDGKSGEFLVRLNGTINGCGAIKPRFPAKASELARFEERFLPALGVGLLLVSTPKGLKTHAQAKQENTGGRLLAFVY